MKKKSVIAIQLLVLFSVASGGTLANVKISFAGSSHSVSRRLEYDHVGRLLRTWHKIDVQPEILLSSNAYNELGQLIDKKLHSTVANASDARQSVDYRYNIRGWLTSMNNASLTSDGGATNDDTGDYFGMELSYNTIDADLSNNKLFSGNSRHEVEQLLWDYRRAEHSTSEGIYV